MKKISAKKWAQSICELQGKKDAIRIARTYSCEFFEDHGVPIRKNVDAKFYQNALIELEKM